MKNMSKEEKYSRFSNLTYEDFQRLAKDDALSPNEKIGFPNEYREGRELDIFRDIVGKVPALATAQKQVLDIGPGCSPLASLIIKNSIEKNQKLVLVDSAEMLSQLPDGENIEKLAAFYPKCESLFQTYAGKFDAIIVYSVFQYIFVEANIWEFLDKSLSLLSPGGRMLIGDIPNNSKRKRFFSSETGIKFHQNFSKTLDSPVIKFNQLEENQIDDSVIYAILARARNQGFQTYVLPQGETLPMANRREDILVVRD